MLVAVEVATFAEMLHWSSPGVIGYGGVVGGSGGFGCISFCKTPESSCPTIPPSDPPRLLEPPPRPGALTPLHFCRTQNPVTGPSGLGSVQTGGGVAFPVAIICFTHATQMGCWIFRSMSCSACADANDGEIAMTIKTAIESDEPIFIIKIISHPREHKVLECIFEVESISPRFMR